MTSEVDIVNRALGECGVRATIASLTDNSPAGVSARLNYAPTRREILRAAQWGWARKTIALALLGAQTDTPPGAPFPWGFKYAYPSDCLHMRYVLPPPPVLSSGTPATGTQFLVPWMGPSRAFRFLPAYDDTSGTPVKVLLSNVQSALAVYTVDVTNPDIWDSLFTNAIVMTLANRFVIPLSGNVKMKSSYAQMAERAVLEARVADGNEAIPTADVEVDWITTRGLGSPFGYGVSPGGAFDQGLWFGGYSNIAWSA